MLIEILTTEDLDNFRLKLIEDITEVLRKKGTPQKKWLKSAEVRKLLNIAPGTLQSLRNNKTISYTQMGSIYYYSYEDIMIAMEKNRTAI